MRLSPIIYTNSFVPLSAVLPRNTPGRTRDDEATPRVGWRSGDLSPGYYELFRYLEIDLYFDLYICVRARSELFNLIDMFRFSWFFWDISII